MEERIVGTQPSAGPEAGDRRSPTAEHDALAFRRIAMSKTKRIALIAHDNKKLDLLDWMTFNKGSLARHELCATRTTGELIATRLGLDVTEFRSGPLGGDQQIGAKIADGGIDFLIFFWDPLEPHPHDPDVRALLRIAVVWNIPIACNRASADFMISSPLMAEEYERLVPQYDEAGQTQAGPPREGEGGDSPTPMSDAPRERPGAARDA